MVPSNRASLMASVASMEEIKKRINDRMNQLYHKEPNGTYAPFVCTFCDEFLTVGQPVDLVSVETVKKDKVRDMLSWGPAHMVRPDLIKYYSFEGDTECLNGNTDFLKGLCLSPRGRLREIKKGRHINEFGFTSCKQCMTAIKGKTCTMPLWAIINNNYVGAAPTCLEDLTDVELALLTPVHKHGYSFVYTGGKMNALTTNCTMIRVKERISAKTPVMRGNPPGTRAREQQIAEAAKQFECMGLNDRIVVLITGKVTRWQHSTATRKSTIRTQKIMEAVEWLCANHEKWKNVDLQKIEKDVQSRIPIVIDKSNIVESENANVENRELITCYYPDAATDENRGGFDNMDTFKEYVTEMGNRGYDLQCRVNLNREFVDNDNSDQLISACLLQFPYGLCGPPGNVDLQDYLAHLSRKADKVFQTPMIQLLMYSQVSKVRLLNAARLQVRRKVDATVIANGFDAEELEHATALRGRGHHEGGTRVARKILRSVDAISTALPHTNEAARRARLKGQAMQHHFGQASVFLTVTFDDENSFLMQVLSGVLIDEPCELTKLSNAELEGRSIERRTLRLDFPGIAAFNFEMLLQIVIEEVIGWDTAKNRPRKNGGFFGVPLAYHACVEEQGRKTLHSHLSIYIERYAEIQTMLHCGTAVERRYAESELEDYFDHISSTKLFPTIGAERAKAFDHRCSERDKRKRKAPEVVDDQALRNMRHRHGYSTANGLFAYCGECHKTWTYEQLVADCVKAVDEPRIKNKETTINCDTNDDHIPAAVSKERLLACCVEYQLPTTDYREINATVVNAVYNPHISSHTAGCFKCQKVGKGSTKKRGHVCNETCVCRYNLPDRKRVKATVKNVRDKVKWFTWSGETTDKPLYNILPKRERYDLFQNISCPAISESKMTCNSNVQLITDGPLSQYIFGYQYAGTQAEDSAHYKLVNESMKRVDARLHGEDRSEALRLLTRAAFAHDKKNIVSAPLASYLTRHNSRFLFSHDFVYCPLNDLVKLHDGEHVSCTVRFHTDNKCSYENQALHYLCRPEELEELSLREFTEKYYVTKTTMTNVNNKSVMPMLAKTAFHSHPSAFRSPRKKIACAQGVAKRDETALCSVSQWSFPDTADFGGNIITCAENCVNAKMEKYAQMVLTLLYPHRGASCIKTADTHFPYVHKLRQIFDKDTRRQKEGVQPQLFSSENMMFLQNIQDAARNAVRYKLGQDDLESVTLPFQVTKKYVHTPGDKEDEQVEDSEEEEENDYNDFLEFLKKEDDASANDQKADRLPKVLEELHFPSSGKNSADKFGCYCKPSAPLLQNEDNKGFPNILHLQCAHAASSTEPTLPTDTARRRHSGNKLVELYLTKTQARPRRIFNDVNMDVHEANGTVPSIREWSKAAFPTDEMQQRGFECLIASFLLTFYDDAQNDDAGEEPMDSRIRNCFRRAKQALLVLQGIEAQKDKQDTQLIALLHGPGGSGKSAVINLVQNYARAFCELLDHPYTSRTIVITAMSGVAATLLHGETTHSVCALNRNGITAEERESFRDTRLFIVDEISFAADTTITKIESRLRDLSGNLFNKYGALNVVFAGDYSQLKPILNQGNTVYETKDCAAFHRMLNCFIELDGMHRFREDMEWGRCLRRFREGVPTSDDISTINQKCNVAGRNLPPGIQVASFYNETRDSVNTEVFERYCEQNQPRDRSTVLESAVLIFMDELEISNNGKTYNAVNSNKMKKLFYTTVGENGCRMNSGSRRNRVDPVLKLYVGCPMMHTANSNVPSGQANGTRVSVEKVLVKLGEEPFTVTLPCRTRVLALFASQVKAIRLAHIVEDITPSTFEVKAQSFPFRCKMDTDVRKLDLSLKGKQFPVISNSCTTGHKLQGSTVDALLVYEWSYKDNWPYVVLSRVKKMTGLYLRQPLDADVKKYAMPAKMKSMLQKFRDKIALKTLTQEEYKKAHEAFQRL